MPVDRAGSQRGAATSVIVDAGAPEAKPAAAGVSRNVWILGVVSLFADISSEMVYPLVPLFAVLKLLAAGDNWPQRPWPLGSLRTTGKGRDALGAAGPSPTRPTGRGATARSAARWTHHAIANPLVALGLLAWFRRRTTTAVF
jgi:hypothetical protein